MDDLKNAFLKAGLVDKHTAEKVERKKRPPRDRRRKREEAAGHPAHSDLTTKVEFRDERSDRPFVGCTDIQEALRAGRVESVSGKRRFHFLDGRGQIPFLELNANAVSGLTNGAYAIVACEGDAAEKYVVVTAATAERLQALDKDLVLFWNKSE